MARVLQRLLHHLATANKTFIVIIDRPPFSVVLLDRLEM